MVQLAGPRVRRVLLIFTAIALGCATNARGTRIDINDPTLLGPVLLSVDVGQSEYDASRISEVRFANGIYSYIYAVQSGW